MKKTFTLLIAAIAAILIMALPGKVVGQTRSTKTEGFEKQDVNTNYQGTVNISTTNSDCGIAWTIYYGNVQNSVALVGSKSAQLRLYNNGTKGYIKTTTAIDDLSKVEFKAKRANGTNGNLLMNVYYSTTGADNSWQTLDTDVAVSTSQTEDYSYNIPSGGKYFKISVSNNSTNPNSKKNCQLTIDNVVFTYGSSSVTAPTIAGAGGATVFDNSLSVTLTPASGTTMYYTTNGNTPSSSTGTGYTSAQVINITATTTVKAIAYDNSSNPSSVTSVTFNKSLTTMDEIFTKATALGTSGGSVYITFNNWVVSGVSGDNAFVTDGTKGFIIYKSSHGLTVGKVLTGSKVQCTLKMYKGSAEITSWGSGFTTTTGGTVTEQETTIDELSGVNTGSLIQLNHVTYNGTNLVDDNDHIIKPYTTLFGSVLSYLSNGHTYNVIGVYQQYEDEEPHNILARSSADITEVHDPTITVSPTTNLAVPNYIQETPVGNIETGTLTVGGTYLTHDITVALAKGASSDFEIYDAANTEWTHTLTLLKTNQTVSNTNISVRLKSGKNAGNYSDNINITSEDATPKSVAVTGSVTNINVTYDANNADSGTAPSDATNYNYNNTVTVKGNTGNLTKDGYTFGGWNTQADGLGTNYTEGNTFSITSNTTLYAKWNPASFNISKSDMTGGSVTVKIGDVVVESATTGATVTLVVSPAANHALSALTVTKSPSGNVTLSPSVSSSVLTYTFTMPASTVTVAATFVERYSLNIDFESSASTYKDWIFSTMDSKQTTTITAHSGTYYGTTNGGNPAYIQTARKIAKPQSLTCYVSRQTTNSTSSTWKVQVSSNGTTWTDVGASQSATSMNKGEWVEITRDLSSYSYVYVRVYYSGGTATRNIDDLSLVYTPEPYEISVTSNANGTITATDGSTTISGGENANFEYDKTITLTAEGDETHMFSTWNVTETESGNTITVTDNKFNVPTCAVIVAATFVESWTFTYNINGHEVTKKYAKNNATITLPTTSEYVPEGYVIIGWTATEGDVSSPIASATASQDRTLYAVFSKIVYGDFVKVTSSQSDWSGFYLIVYEETSVAYDGSLSSTYLDNTPNTIGVTITSSTIEHNATTEASMFKIEKNNSNYTIRSASGYYIGRTESSNGLDIDANTKYNHTISYSNNVVSITSSGGPTLQFLKSGDNSKFRYYASTQKAVALYKASVSYEGAYTHIYPSNATAEGDINVGLTGPIVIENGGVLDMSTYTLTCTDPTKLIIEDGGQLILKNNNNTSVAATIKKDITAGVVASKGDAQYWYAISSPVNATSATITGNTNLITGTEAPNRYDLYRYDETAARWENYQAHNGVGGDFLKLENGRGYLYRNESDLTITFTGTVNTSASYTVTAEGPTEYTGFNLIGNPYTHEIYKGGAFPNSVTSSYTLANGFYKLNPATGGWVPGTDNTTAIAPNEGFLVQATTSGTITIDNTVAKTRYNNEYLQFTVANSEYEDVAYALFDEGLGLSKINHRNADIPMLYINQGGKNYAIATMSDNAKSFNLNFKAMSTGKYTLSYKATGEYNYLHVIDRLTGTDVDMLLEGEYSFIATPNDNENRFIVRLEYMPNYSEGNDEIFAFQNGNEILVSGEGELQIFDVTGRSVMTTTISGAESINLSAQGVYIFRLVGSEIKTQKIVVR